MPRGGLDHIGTEGNIVNEVSVHHIAVNPVGSAFGYADDLLTQLAEVRCENRRGDDGLGGIHVLSDSV
jgi:hypothetical protein